jgi:hypothetical protein
MTRKIGSVSQLTRGPVTNTVFKEYAGQNCLTDPSRATQRIIFTEANCPV